MDEAAHKVATEMMQQPFAEKTDVERQLPVAISQQTNAFLKGFANMLAAPSYASQSSLLSDRAIMRYRKAGEVVIEPFNQENLHTTSYDVTLGNFYYRANRENHYEVLTIPAHSTASGAPERPNTLLKGLLYDPFKDPATNIWSGPYDANSAASISEDAKESGLVHWVRRFRGEDDKVSSKNFILLRPGESILAHTNEFIGGVNHTVGMMKARSSMGRIGIEVCKCAGWGDIGYFNRWTMEITNNSQNNVIPLRVGMRIAQIVFFDTEGTLGGTYNSTGKYQTTNDLTKLQAEWHPSQMLPKLFKDKLPDQLLMTLPPQQDPSALEKLKALMNPIDFVREIQGDTPAPDPSGR